MDQLKEERERGLTIALSYRKIETKKFQVTIIDAPGHADFIKNMITGTSQADAAILVVAAPEGVKEQTTEHIFLCRTMGVEQMAVAINKMDMVNYAQDKFEKVKQEVSEILKMAGYNLEKIHFIPISALKGDNVTKASSNMPWYKGPTIVELFDLFEEPKKPVDMPLRMPIEDVFSISGIGAVSVGKVMTGKVKVGDKVLIIPAKTGKGIEGEVRSIEMHHEPLQEAIAGDNIGINIRGVGKDDVKRGDVICHPDSAPKLVEEFVARIVVINPLGVIAQGYTPVFHIHTAQIPARFEELVRTIDPRSGETLKDHPDHLERGDIAVVRIKPLKPVIIEPQSKNPYLSRFAVRDAGKTVASGVCIEVVEKQ